MNNLLTNSFLLFNMYFLFLLFSFLCYFIVAFIVLHVKQKDAHSLKKMREKKFENKSKNTSHTG